MPWNPVPVFHHTIQVFLTARQRSCGKGIFSVVSMGPQWKEGGVSVCSTSRPPLRTGPGPCPICKKTGPHARHPVQGPSTSLTRPTPGTSRTSPNLFIMKHVQSANGFWYVILKFTTGMRSQCYWTRKFARKKSTSTSAGPITYQSLFWSGKFEFSIWLAKYIWHFSTLLATCLCRSRRSVWLAVNGESISIISNVGKIWQFTISQLRSLCPTKLYTINEKKQTTKQIYNKKIALKGWHTSKGIDRWWLVTA